MLSTDKAGFIALKGQGRAGVAGLSSDNSISGNDNTVDGLSPGVNALE